MTGEKQIEPLHGLQHSRRNGPRVRSGQETSCPNTAS
jgi:hypothetical protein